MPIGNYDFKKVEEGIITPAQKVYYSAIACGDEATTEKGYTYEYIENNESKKLEYSEKFDLVKKIIESTDKQVDFEEKTEKKEVEHKEYSTGDEDEKDAFIDKKMKEYREKNKDATAREALNYANAEYEARLQKEDTINRTTAEITSGFGMY